MGSFKNAKNICAAVFDLDGTLLRSDKTISPRTAKAVQAIADHGWYVAIATGRHPKSALRYLEEMGVLTERTLAVTFNGSALINIHDFKEAGAPDKAFPIMHEDTASMEEGQAVVSLCHQFALHAHAYSKQHGLCTENTNICSLREIFHAGVEFTDGFDFENAPADERYFKLICVGRACDLDAFRAALPQYIHDHFEVMRTDDNFLEFIPHHCSKGTALKWLCEEAHIELSQIVAFGDAENDHTMIKNAGLGVAMGNATLDLRQISDHITASNDDDGIALVLEDLLKTQTLRA